KGEFMYARHFATLGIMLLAVAASPAQTAVGTAITYQGQLKSSGSPANGSFNMDFKLFDAATAGNQVGPTLQFDGSSGNPPPVTVVDGSFTIQLDFTVSPYTDNQARWLEIQIDGQALSPRQLLTASPFALNTRGLNVDASGNVGIGINSGISI